MTVIDQFVSGLIDEKLDRGVRAMSWMAASIYVMIRSLSESPDSITLTLAIEASAIVGTIRCANILWTRFISPKHRLWRLHEPIERCLRLVESKKKDEPETMVRLVILREKLAMLGLGLPERRIEEALEALHLYAKEKQLHIARTVYPRDAYYQTDADRRSVLESIVSKQTTLDGKVWMVALRAHQVALRRRTIAGFIVMGMLVVFGSLLVVKVSGWDAVGLGSFQSIGVVSVVIAMVVFIGTRYDRRMMRRTFYSKETRDRIFGNTA